MQLAESLALAGEAEEANEIAEQALALAISRGERGHEAYTRRLLAHLALNSVPPDTDAALDQFREALNLANELGMRPLAMHCHIGLAEVHAAREDTSAAKQHHLEAVRLCQAINMRPPTGIDGTATGGRSTV